MIAEENYIPLETNSTIPQNKSNDTWRRPIMSKYKCNFNAGFNRDTLQTTTWCIIRVFHGITQIWGSASVGVVVTPLEAEAKALLIAMQHTWCRDCDSISFEGDSKVLIDILNGSSQDFNIENICYDILHWSNKFTTCFFQHTKRSNNMHIHWQKEKNSAFLFFKYVFSYLTV